MLPVTKRLNSADAGRSHWNKRCVSPYVDGNVGHANRTILTPRLHMHGVTAGAGSYLSTYRLSHQDCSVNTVVKGISHGNDGLGGAGIGIGGKTERRRDFGVV